MDLIADQCQIIGAQRSINEEQQRLTIQQLNKLQPNSDAGGFNRSSTGGSTISSCSVRSSPADSSSTETELEVPMLAMCDVKVEPDSEPDSELQTINPVMLDVTQKISPAMLDVTMDADSIIDPVNAVEQAFMNLREGAKGKVSTPVQVSCSNSSSLTGGRQNHDCLTVSERDSGQKWRENLQKVMKYVNTTLDGAPPVDRGPSGLFPHANQLKALMKASQERAEKALQKPGEARSEAIHPQEAGAAPSVTMAQASPRVPDSKAEQPRSLPGLPGSQGTLGHNLTKEAFMFDVESWVLCANISQNGKWLCAASDDTKARVYDLETCQSNSLYRCFDHGDRVWTADFSRDNQTLCTSSSDGCARVFAVQDGCERSCFYHNDIVRSASFSPVGEFLCTASHDRTARIFNLAEGSNASEVSRFEHPGWVLSAGWSPMGESLCTAADDMTARIFDVNTGKQVQIYGCGMLTSVKFHPDGRRLCTGSYDMEVRIYDVRYDMGVLQHFQYPAPVCSANFSPDGRWLCTACSDKHAYIHDMSTGKELLCFKHGGRVCSANFSPDGRRLCTGSEDGCSRVFGYAMQSMLTLVAMTAK